MQARRPTARSAVNGTNHLPITWSVVRATLRELHAPSLRAFGCLLALATWPEPPSISELASALLASKPAATRIVEQLENLGLIERLPNLIDGRMTFIRLTAKGQALIRRITK